MASLLITNCQLYDAAEAATASCALLQDGKIAGIRPMGADIRADGTLGARGRLRAPGLIDVRIREAVALALVTMLVVAAATANVCANGRPATVTAAPHRRGKETIAIVSSGAKPTTVAVTSSPDIRAGSSQSISPNPIYNLTGFAALGSGTTGGGVIPETDSAYRKVSTPLEFAQALYSANKNKGVRVIEIMNDLDLGWNEVGPEVQEMASTPFTPAIPPKLHPVLLETGVSSITINPKKGGLTIFSTNGAAIRHCIWNIKATSNIIIRNLKFDELWEWDEASKGDYDKNNWDFLTLGVGGGTVHHVWIDHCTFTKAYDGIIDTKGGAANVTYSWNKYVGDDGATDPNSFVWQQIDSLEANRTACPMYNFLRTRGFSTTDIVTILQGPGKLHGIGELSLHPVNVNSTVTFHHQWYINAWDRLPRLAGGTVHNYNIYVDDTGVLAARRLRDSITAAMSAADRDKLNDTYNFKPPINGSISTENGAMLVEKSMYIDCLWPLRNNQTDPSNPIYTGKIMATDTIYIFHETDGSTTHVRGDSTDPGNPLGPFQAPIIPFSWNTPDGSPPYASPPMDDPNDLEAIVTSPTAGAGAGVVTWDKSNWLQTSYESVVARCE